MNREQDHLTTTTTFAQLGVPDYLIEALDQQGITSPFPIQALAIPDALDGRDICGRAKTGSGKTLAFGLPIVDRLHKADPRRPIALVLVPTRELCVQVSEALEPLCELRDFSLLSVYGGVSMKRQIDALNAGVEVVVATPGRLLDLAERKAMSIEQVEMVVIDEADQMADMGFLPQVRYAMRQIKREHQTYLFSATLDGPVGHLIDSYTNNPAFHEVTSDTVTVETSEHRFLEVHHMDKAKVAARIAESADRMLVFVRTKRSCDYVARDLRDLGVHARPIHGDLPQPKRERALAEFTSGKSPVLVATNVAARGLHIEGVDIVLHFDPPEDSRTYVHRSGRTARAGEEGLVITMVEWDQMAAVKRIQEEAGLVQPIVKMFSNDDRLDDLGAWKPLGSGEDAKPVAPRRSGRRRRKQRLL
ncbi:MAG: DEAD/DEAH box helicase [Acidimicrobiia bacterium]|nr:DEAD/DEAH box helicase [Acidimicrobiia bacterium]